MLELNVHCFSMNMRALSTILKHLCGFNRISTCCFRCCATIHLRFSTCCWIVFARILFGAPCFYFVIVFIFFSVAPTRLNPYSVLCLCLCSVSFASMPLACVPAYSLLLYHHSQREIRRELWRFVNRNSFCI